MKVPKNGTEKTVFLNFLKIQIGFRFWITKNFGYLVLKPKNIGFWFWLELYSGINVLF